VDHIPGHCDYCEKPFPIDPTYGAMCFTVCGGRRVELEQPVAAVCQSCYDECHHCGADYHHTTTAGLCEPH